MAGALGTYAAALITLGSALAIGAGIHAACGGREWSWTAPAVGLAAATILAWWTVRLPGHGLTALLVLLVASLAGGAVAARRLDGIGDAARAGAPVLALALFAGSIPFVAAGHFGVLGTGFNVDMSQHLFAASWLADPTGAAPGLFEQGYPLGPHAIAVAAHELGGDLTVSFSGVTIALPVIAGLTALSGLRDWPAWRATIAAALPALAYLVATYLAQGAFKELFEIALLFGFALWLAEQRGAPDRGGWLRAAPAAVIAAGTLYAYSSPGLAWIVATLAAWGTFELLRRRGEVGAPVRDALPMLATGVAITLLLALPELDRITDFGGSVGTVSEADRAGPGPTGGDLLATRDPGAAREPGDGSLPATRAPSVASLTGDASGRGHKLEFDDDLGNLFGQISPLEALGIWPSGDFRVAPGDGGVPAAAFCFGALLGALALAVGVSAAARAGETALLAALAAALAIWIGARIGSTPYTAAKALAILGAVAMLLSARGVLRPPDAVARPLLPGRPGAVVAAAFVLAASASSALALAKAPVGPGEYEPGARQLSQRFAGRPTLVFIADDVYSDQHGADFYGWEFREATPPCVLPASAADPSAVTPPGWRRVAVVGGAVAMPYLDLDEVAAIGGVTLYATDRPRPHHRGPVERTCPPAPASG